MAPLTNGDRETVRVGVVERSRRWASASTPTSPGDLWGKNKVHPDIDPKSVEKIGLRPEEVVFVSRGRFDVVGAKAAGLKVIWVKRAREALEDHGYAPDWEVEDFFGVAEVLEPERP
jgi:beta-phosphoglucomutase-like phosphatase (HAD superfamily)